jgi:hypothetical protein
MRLYLRNGIQGDADHDQERRASEIKRNVEKFVKNIRQNTDCGEIQGATERNTVQDPEQIVRGFFSPA